MRSFHVAAIKCVLCNKIRQSTVDEKPAGNVLTAVIWDTFIDKVVTDRKMIAIRNRNQLPDTLGFASAEEFLGSAKP